MYQMITNTWLWIIELRVFEKGEGHRTRWTEGERGTLMESVLGTLEIDR